jgi:hypothetical protein
MSSTHEVAVKYADAAEQALAGATFGHERHRGRRAEPIRLRRAEAVATQGERRTRAPP